MRKVTRSSLKSLQTTLPFGSKQLIFSNRNSSLNYSTSLKKGNYPAPLTNNNNNSNKTMKNLFAVKYYSTSTLLADKNTTTTLDPTLFENWTKEEVCSLLCSAKGKGGAGLTETKVQPLYDSGFDGTSVSNIVTTMKDKDKYFAIDRLATKYPAINPDTLETVVNWVDNLLKTRLYHLWPVEQLEKHLSMPITSGGAGLEKTELNDAVKKIQQPKTIINKEIADKFESWKDILTIKDIEIPKEFEKISWDVLKRELQVNDVESKRRIDTIVEIINSTNITKIEQTTIIKQVLEPFCKNLEDSVTIFNERERSSVEIFNKLVQPFGLDNPKSEIYIYPNLGDAHKELSKSCGIIGLDFGPTFPEDKYSERVDFLDEKGSIAVFFEPPGTGKTHFAFHLTKANKYLVIPIDHIVCANIIDTLEHTSYRNDMDAIVGSFADYYSRLVMFLTEYCKRIPNIDSLKKIHQYILRFLWNGSREHINKEFLSFGKETSLLLKLVPTQSKIVWFLDEAQILGSRLDGKVPRQNEDQEKGNMITLLCSSLRNTGSMVLTTTFVSFIEGKIEKRISTDNRKKLQEQFSHQFVHELPVLQAKDVEHFLNFFINTKNAKNDEREIWNLVSCFLQGTFRTSNIFLEYLYIHQSGFDPRFAKPTNSYTQLIFNALSSTMIDRNKLEIQSIDKKFKILKYKIVFHKLAIFGEAKIEDPDGLIYDFLMKRGISCTFNYEKNLKVFKLVSPLEKMRLLESLKTYYKRKDWLENCCKFLITNSNLTDAEMGTLSEVVYAYLISRYFDDIKQIFKGTELEKYNLEAEYHFEDSVISKRSSSDIKLSTIMFNTLYRNRFGMTAENNPYPLGDEKFGIQSYFSFPCEEARAEFIAILVLDKKYQPSTTLPYCIPLIASVSRATDNAKAKLDFLTTDITKFYTENIENPIPSKPSSAEKLIEYEKVKDILSYLDDGMMLRIMIHPNMRHDKPLNKRTYTRLQGSTIISFDAIKNKKGHFILDLHSGSALIQKIEEKTPIFKFPNK